MKYPTSMASRVADYLFCEMCSNSKAGNARPELERWYEDALEYYETLLSDEDRYQK